MRLHIHEYWWTKAGCHVEQAWNQQMRPLFPPVHTGPALIIKSGFQQMPDQVDGLVKAFNYIGGDAPQVIWLMDPYFGQKSL